MKTIILTIDYELFLGKKTGKVNETMIEPTKKLASILYKNGSRMTIFWDVLHYYKLLEMKSIHTELKQELLLIEKQILDLASTGHDIQLHLHPHWLDAEYESNKWNFTYDRFRLHDLSKNDNSSDINTILGCISISKKIIEDLVRKVKPNYKVTTFRAGGYLIEPFEKLKNAFLKNEILVDSSICPGSYNESDISPYNFHNYPEKLKYNFDSTPKIINPEGNFTEIPITSFKISGIRNTYYRVLRKIKYPALESERKGSGVGSTSTGNKAAKRKNLCSDLLNTINTQFTTDSNFREKFNYMHKKAPEYSTMILHPKLLNNHTLEILDDYVSTNRIRFISIQNFIS